MTQASTEKVNLLGLTLAQMEAFFEQLGEKRFRAGQVMKWIHHFGVDDFADMTNIGKALRAKLDEAAYIRGPEVVSEDISADGTRKWVIRVASGSCVETVYIPQKGRGTLCVSSQAGCALDCSFCSTGKQGFNSDLTAAEIIGQVWVANKSFGTIPARMDRAITNVVMMAWGSLNNFDNVAAMHIMLMTWVRYSSARQHCPQQVAPMADRLARKLLACLVPASLHDELRDHGAHQQEISAAVILEANATLAARKRTLTVEYTLLAGINDQPEHAAELAQLLRDVPCKINLIPFNPFPHSGYERPSNNAIHRFQDALHHAGYNVTVRTPRGDDIDAACGQLVGQVADRTRRSERYIAVRQINA